MTKTIETLSSANLEDQISLRWGGCNMQNLKSSNSFRVSNYFRSPVSNSPYWSRLGVVHFCRNSCETRHQADSKSLDFS